MGSRKLYTFSTICDIFCLEGSPNQCMAKMDKVRAIQRKSNQNFQRKSFKSKEINHFNIFVLSMMIFSGKLNKTRVSFQVSFRLGVGGHFLSL